MLAGEVKPADHIIFADTGWEPQSVYDHLDKLKVLIDNAGIPFHMVSAGNIREDALTPDETGRHFVTMPLHQITVGNKKSMVRRQCTGMYKIDPILKLQRKLVGLQKGQRHKDQLGTTVIGISYDETQRMRDAKFSWLRNEYPLVDLKMTRQDCIKWCDDHGYGRPPRSACIGCPFKNDDQWRQLRDETPDEWADAVDFDHRMRAMLNADVRFIYEPFLHRQMKPLDQVDLRTAKDKGQNNLFDDDETFNQECEGMCGL
jgi:3'-phosphoadenosine 5'-phosphosulfate sulfotransferase (PAPS reductase)/FAD synthetase